MILTSSFAAAQALLRSVKADLDKRRPSLHALHYFQCLTKDTFNLATFPVSL